MLFALSLSASAQDRYYKFSAFTYTEPGAFKDGPNLGIGIDYQMEMMYFKAESFIFPDLNGITYTDLTIGIGFNWHIGTFDTFRVFGGIQGGWIFRDHVYPTIGPESGLDWNITDRIYIGIACSYMVRQDGRLWSPYAEDYWKTNGKLRIGFRF